MTTPTDTVDEAGSTQPEAGKPAEAAVKPLRVLLIDDDGERAKLVEEGLAGSAVVHHASRVHGRILLDLIAEIQPDVIIMDCQSPDRDTIESLRSVVQHNPKPIVMFVEEEGSERMAEAIDAGVSAYVIDGLKPKRVRPVIDIAIKRFQVMDGLRSELRRTRDDLAARKIIERAKGLLMARQGLSEEEAFAAMRTMSQQRGKPLRDIAENVIAILDLLNTPSTGHRDDKD